MSDFVVDAEYPNRLKVEMTFNRTKGELRNTDSNDNISVTYSSQYIYHRRMIGR